MAESENLDGPAIGGFSSGDISLTAPAYEPTRGRAGTTSSRRTRRQVTPTTTTGTGNPIQIRPSTESQTQSRGSEQTVAEDTDDAPQDAEADLLTKATQPVTGLRMR